jgi:hypothetical protein
MTSELAAVEQEFSSALIRLHQLRKDVPAAAWGRRPAPEQWSPGECVAHLNLTSTATIPLVRAGLDEARRMRRSVHGRYQRDVIGWLIWRSLKPSGGFKAKTTPAFVPASDRSPDELIAEFELLQAEQLACVREADGLPINLVKIASPFNLRIRYNLFSALSILARHQHRHLWQAERAAR